MTVPGASPLAVIAVGGNALITNAAQTSIEDQSLAAEAASRHIADIVEKGWNVLVIHGNGPQVGFILRRSEIAVAEVPRVPMDYAGADTQGAMGFMFQRALYNEFQRRGLDRKPVVVVTQVQVDKSDPAFDKPTKPIGSHVDEATAGLLEKTHGWTLRHEPGRGWRRVVSSPMPRRVVDLDAIRTLVGHGFVVIACGGGGIPVVADASGALKSVEAVIDKDLTASLVARELGATMFVIATEVDRVALDFDKPERRWLSSMTVAEAKRYCDEGHFPEGSMGPKIRALIGFVEAGCGSGLVTSIPRLGDAFAGEAGTRLLAGAAAGTGDAAPARTR